MDSQCCVLVELDENDGHHSASTCTSRDLQTNILAVDDCNTDPNDLTRDIALHACCSDSPSITEQQQAVTHIHDCYKHRRGIEERQGVLLAARKHNAMWTGAPLNNHDLHTLFNEEWPKTFASLVIDTTTQGQGTSDQFEDEGYVEGTDGAVIEEYIKRRMNKFGGIRHYSPARRRLREDNDSRAGSDLHLRQAVKRRRRRRTVHQIA